jgi:hypothetical protein
LLREMSALFRFDFSTVRVHTDDRAAASAADIHALAYAAGPHIVFGQSAFQPATRSGRQVLAHELAHVIQEPRITSSKLVLGDLDTDKEVNADRAAASIAGHSEKAAHVETNRPLVSTSQIGRRDLPTSVSVVRRIYVPPSPVPKLTPAEFRGTQRFDELTEATHRWRHPYTKPTREAANNLLRAMNEREFFVESLQLDPAAEKRIQSVTDWFFDDLKQELRRKPQDDPNQEGNVLAIWRKWDAAFTSQLELEKLKQDVPEEEEEPGDYPRPENPLDLPQGEDEVARIA